MNAFFFYFLGRGLLDKTVWVKGRVGGQSLGWYSFATLYILVAALNYDQVWLVPCLILTVCMWTQSPKCICKDPAQSESPDGFKARALEVDSDYREVEIRVERMGAPEHSVN